MFANVGEKYPAKGIFTIAITWRMRADNLISFLPILFDKHHVAPGGSAEVAGVVVRISRPDEPVIRHLVPFFARDLAGFATDAHGWISEEADLHIFLHVIVPPLVRALCSFTNHLFTSR
jgi:hypothetical protein